MCVCACVCTGCMLTQRSTKAQQVSRPSRLSLSLAQPHRKAYYCVLVTTSFPEHKHTHTHTPHSQSSHHCVHGYFIYLLFSALGCLLLSFILAVVLFLPPPFCPRHFVTAVCVQGLVMTLLELSRRLLVSLSPCPSQSVVPSYCPSATRS